MKTFSFNPPINFFEEGKWLLAVTKLEATNFVFNITNQNNSCTITTPERWIPEELKNFLTKYLI